MLPITDESSACFVLTAWLSAFIWKWGFGVFLQNNFPLRKNQILWEWWFIVIRMKKTFVWKEYLRRSGLQVEVEELLSGKLSFPFPPTLFWSLKPFWRTFISQSIERNSWTFDFLVDGIYLNQLSYVQFNDLKAIW